MMADLRSVNSPRRILSLSKRKNTTIFHSDDKPSHFGFSGDHGPKTSELYGFVLSITAVVTMVIFLIWAYVPDQWLHLIGLFYYPSKYWALAIPTYVMMTIILALGFYIGLNFMATPSPNSFTTLYDEYTREAPTERHVKHGERPIDPLYDIDLPLMNKVMFGGVE